MSLTLSFSFNSAHVKSEEEEGTSCKVCETVWKERDVCLPTRQVAQRL